MLSHVHCTAAATALPGSCAPGSDLFGTALRDLEAEGFAGDIRPKSLTVRIEPRARGEVVTVYRTEINGQASSCSMVLYLDGVARGFQQGECSGTQSSRRIDSQTIEVLRNCGPGAWTRFVRRRAPKDQLVLERLCASVRAAGAFG